MTIFQISALLKALISTKGVHDLVVEETIIVTTVAVVTTITIVAAVVIAVMAVIGATVGAIVMLVEKVLAEGNFVEAAVVVAAAKAAVVAIAVKVTKAVT